MIPHLGEIEFRADRHGFLEEESPYRDMRQHATPIAKVCVLASNKISDA
jgi:hypothetical protein